MIGQKKLAIIIQCRLSSTRLPGKALKNLGGKSVFEWTLDAMKMVKADSYMVATDDASYSELSPLAQKHGWEIIAGPLDDVLERYCIAIKKTGCKAVLRATADNPFLFYEAAQSLVEEFYRQEKIAHCDYMTWTGLPHGCGVEIFWSESLLKAKELTADSYDHEHVGPAIYNHKDRFTSLFYKAPSRFYYPDFRTTIDTPADYRRALAIVNKLSEGKAPSEPYTTEQILSAVKDENIHDTILFYPCTKKGCGTGHLRRCLGAAIETGGFVYISDQSDLSEKDEIIKYYLEHGLKEYQIVNKFPEKNEYALIVDDGFCTEKEIIEKLSQAACLCAIDEGSEYTKYCDFLFDVLPSYKLDRPANIADPSFIDKPNNIRTEKVSEIKNVLISLGGEDPAGLTLPAEKYFSGTGRKVKTVTASNPVPDLKEHLAEYDLVVTHYGFTAFEAVAAGTAVVLLATTKLHENLAKKYGFVCLNHSDLENEKCDSLLAKKDKLFPVINNNLNRSLSEKIKEISHGKRYVCPVCEEHSPDNPIIARTEHRTFRRCKKCSMIYISWNSLKNKKYEKEYFSEEYKKQYGKTYLEDFDSIKETCYRRLNEINNVLRVPNRSNPKILDIGCAFGPFLAAASEKGWLPYGTDISETAIEYVRSELLFPAVQSEFPEFDSAKEFGINLFDSVTMWYVIEHFSNLKSILEKVSSLLKTGGIFAFSTPSAEGVSGKKNTSEFFKNSPSDHYTIWEPSKTAKILKQFGFEVVKIVSTGHHPERFPKNKNKNMSKNDLLYKYYSTLSHFMKLGDTFEVYCRKTGK